MDALGNEASKLAAEFAGQSEGAKIAEGLGAAVLVAGAAYEGDQQYKKYEAEKAAEGQDTTGQGTTGNY